MNQFTASAIYRSGSKVLEQIAISLAALPKALRHRREVKNLAELDDWMLRDIGLTRGDVNSALAEPLYLNPSWILVRCVDQRARADRTAGSARKTLPAVSLVRKVA